MFDSSTVMSDRRCTVCKRLCSGHVGPTGPHCSLTPLKDQEILDLDSENSKSSGAEGGGSVVEAKLDSLSSKFDQLLSVVGSLAQRVDASESKRTTAEEKLSLPSPTWPVGKTPPRLFAARHPSLDQHPVQEKSVSETPQGKDSTPVTTRTLARDAELSKLLDSYNSETQESELLRAQL